MVRRVNPAVYGCDIDQKGRELPLNHLISQIKRLRAFSFVAKHCDGLGLEEAKKEPPLRL